MRLLRFYLFLTLCFLIFALLISCASYDDMWAEAEVTGDWAKVQAYEDRMRHRRAREAAELQCIETNAVLFCRNYGSVRDCVCAYKDQF